MDTKNIKNITKIFLVASLLIGMNLFANSFINIIPQPQKLEQKSGNFQLNKNTKIIISENSREMESVADFLQDKIIHPTGYKLPIQEGGSTENSIFLHLDENMPGKTEAYKLDVNAKRVTIAANSTPGIFYGIQTLRQLFPPEFESKQILPGVEWKAQAVNIKDEPRFNYRGMHLDVGRHFFPVSFIKKYIDLLAMHKMNRFHWHLTEDQGWRIEIKKYPKLTRISAFRDETVVGHGGTSNVYDGERYGGFYTQKEVKEIVKYAQKRHVTIIPEIEMPGHSQAVLAAYPEIGCTGGPYEVATTWGVHNEIYCAGKEATFTFLTNVLDEVIDLFPGKYIHIGGDEAPKERWEECSDCQKRIQEEGLKNEHELQSYFIKRIEKYLNSKGRRLIGWDEILEGGLAPEATVMSWRGVSGGIEAAKQGHDVIMTPNTHCYLDYYQADPKTEPLAIGGFLPLERCYSYEPIPEELNSNQTHHILGVQGNVWTEYMNTPEYVEYMAYPRAIALAEVGWSQKSDKDFKNFKKRLEHHYKRLDQLHVNYFYEIPKPQSVKDFFPFLKSCKIELTLPKEEAEIYYTLDGSHPNNNSKKYKNPIKLRKSATIKAITYLPGCSEYSKVKTITAEKLDYLKAVDLNGLKQGLSCKYFEGEFSKIRDFKNNYLQEELTTDNFTIPDLARNSNFACEFKGFLKIDRKNIYTFYLTSDDGSILKIGNQIVIDNDGLHSATKVQGSVALNKGYYPIEVKYFQAGGGATLKLDWNHEYVEESSIIPVENLFHK